MAASGYTPIQLYYSTTASAVPTSGNLLSGELAININDGKLYFKNSGGTVTLLASSGGASGDVVGPASATDTAVALFDGTTGKLLKNSAVTIGTTGNTVISGTDNSNAMLRITQLGTGNALLVEDSANPDATPFVVDASGNVGIGITPTTKFSGYDSGAFTMNLESDTGVTIQSTRYTTDTSGSSHVLRKARGTKASPTVVNDGDVIGVVNFNAYDGSAYIGAAQIQARVDGTPGASDMPGRLVFLTTADGASTTTERMRIDNAGRVGIGATPLATTKVYVAGSATGNATQYGVLNALSAASDVTFLAGFSTSLATAASAFTLSEFRHFNAAFNTIGAGSSVTSQTGFYVSSGLTGATNNYGFYSDIASGTGRWNFYANGTAANYFGGQVQLNQDYIEKRYTANSSTGITLDLANGTMQDITLTATTTITMPTAVAGKSFILLLRSGAGSYGVTWTTVKWPGGTAPTITTTASRLDIYSFFSDGTNWYGITVSQNYTP